MNTQKLEIAINQLERVHRDMNDCANRFILKDAIDQLQEQLTKPVVIKAEGEPLRSCEICKHNKSKGVCIDCKDWKWFEYNGL